MTRRAGCISAVFAEEDTDSHLICFCFQVFEKAVDAVETLESFFDKSNLLFGQILEGNVYGDPFIVVSNQVAQVLAVFHGAPRCNRTIQ